MRRLLDRQLARARDAGGQVDVDALCRMVLASYEEADRERRRIDRAMALMAEELEGANRELERLLDEITMQTIRFEAALHHMPHGLAMYDGTERLVVINDRICELLGLPPDTLRPGMTLTEALTLRHAAGHFPGRTVAEVLAERRALMAAEAPPDSEEQVGDRVLASSARAMPGGGGVVLVQDITERRAAEARIAYLARHDALTGLPNRTQLMTRMAEALARARRDAPFALLCLDLDHFKQVNDSLGHPIGDRLLREVTARLRAELRENDLVARLGGDEFAILQDKAAQPEAVTSLARRLVAAIGAPCEIEGHRIVVGASIGIALAPQDGGTAEALLKAADLALYRAKADGRGAWRFFEPEMDARMQRRRQLEMELREALDQGGFELLYQPLVDIATMRLRGFEALLRRRGTDGTLAPPAEFIPLAEETGLIVPLGGWVLRTACAAAARWPESISVAVNVSVVQFRQPHFVDAVAAALAESGLPPGRLELEVTETIMLEDNVATLAQLHRLRRLGVRISLDDFGTGYSSLSYLRSFPFDKIKIDRSFVRDLAERGEARAIVRAIAGLGASLGMRTTAEGVESTDQLTRLRAEGCTDAQGYLFGRPMSLDAAWHLIAEAAAPLARSA
jgi:diguanylate cyclase (GGDEF)-like protein